MTFLFKKYAWPCRLGRIKLIKKDPAFAFQPRMKSTTLLLAAIGVALAVLAASSEASPAYQVLAEEPDLSDAETTTEDQETTTTATTPTTTETTTTTTQKLIKTFCFV